MTAPATIHVLLYDTTPVHVFGDAAAAERHRESVPEQVSHRCRVVKYVPERREAPAGCEPEPFEAE